jgi:hypothetical protein
VGKAIDGRGNVFALEADDIVRIAELQHHPLRPPAVSPLINRRCRKRKRTTMGRIM